MQAKIWTTVTILSSVLALAGTRLSAQSEDVGVESQAPGSSQTLLTLRLKDRLLSDVVHSIRRKAGANIIIDDEIDETVTIDLKDVPWRRALELVAEAAKCVVVEEAGNVLKVEKPPRVYFAFENADIQNVIDTIAKISGANIVVAPEVQGTITLRLRNIPWRDALDAAVKTLGYVVVEEGRGILRVIPPSNLKEDTVTRHFQLRYVRPRSTYVPMLTSQYVRPQVSTEMQQESATFALLEALERTMTPDLGRLEYFDANNVIIIKDTKPVVEQVAKIIESVDVEPGQVFIDVTFVTTTNNDLLEYGVNVGDNGWTAGLSLGQIPTRLPFNLGAGGFDDDLIAAPNGIGPFADEALNAGNTVIPDVVYGALNFTQVTAALRLLRRDSSAEITQAPKLIALDHQEATIFVGETIRYAQARAEQGQAGGLTLVVEEAPNSPVSTGFQLLVIPHIVPGTDQVIMEIIPKSDSLSGTGQSSLAPAGFDVFTVGAGTQGGSGSIALPRIASSTIATKIMLHSGQTAVLGGLVTDSTSETVTQLPLLGDIPLLGWLFKSRSTQKARTNLVVFVTPSIIRTAEEVQDNLDRILRERREQMKAEYDRIFGGGEQSSTN